MYKTSQPNPSSFKLSGLTCIWAFCDSANTLVRNKPKWILFFVCCRVTCIYIVARVAPVRLRLGEGSTTAGRQHLSGEGGEKRDVSRPGLAHVRARTTHTNTHKRRIRTLTSNIHRSRVTRSALRSSPRQEPGETHSRHTCRVKSPEGDTEWTEKRLSCDYGTANCSANSLLTGVDSRIM